MILRPGSDSELLELIADVLTDARLEGDTRAMLAALLICRERQNFPLIAKLGPAVGMTIGEEKARRMTNEMRRFGYLARAFWRIPYVGTVPAFTNVCGEPRAVACVVAHHRETNSYTGLAARPKAIPK